MPLPDSIKNKPLLITGLEIYWKAFVDLSTDREINMAEGPIRWESIDRWALRHGIWGDDFERLLTIIRGLDGVYIEKQAKKRESKKPRSKKGPIGRKGMRKR